MTASFSFSKTRQIEYFFHFKKNVNVARFARNFETFSVIFKQCAEIIFWTCITFPKFSSCDLSPWWHLPRLITSLGSKISLKWRETQMHFGAAESLRRLIGARKASADAKSRCHTFNSLSSIIIKKSFLMPKSLEIRTFSVITFCSQLRPDDFLFLLNFDNGAVFRQL